MNAVRKLRLGFVFLLAIILGLSLATVPEDAPETAFDESETLPYETTPLFSIVVPQAAAQAPEDRQTRVSAPAVSPLTELRGRRLQGEKVAVHPDSHPLTVLHCSLRC